MSSKECDELTERIGLMMEGLVPIAMLTVAGWSWERRITETRNAAEIIGSQADSMMYGDTSMRQRLERGSSVAGKLATGLAVLAHCPGGVDFAGRHWCTDHGECQRAEAASEERLRNGTLYAHLEESGRRQAELRRQQYPSTPAKRERVKRLQQEAADRIEERRNQRSRR